MDRRKFLKVLGIGATAVPLSREKSLEDVVIEIAPKVQAEEQYAHQAYGLMNGKLGPIADWEYRKYLKRIDALRNGLYGTMQIMRGSTEVYR